MYETKNVSVELRGSIALLVFKTARAWAWAKKNLAFEPYQIVGGNALAVDQRCASEIAEAARAAGL